MSTRTDSAKGRTSPTIKASNTRRLALFDFDGTMVKGDSITALVQMMFRQNLISAGQLIRLIWHTLLWRMGWLPVEAVKSMALAPFRNLGDNKASAFCKSFVEQDLLPRLYPAAIQQMREHRQQGDIVLLVSASPLCYLRYLKEHLPTDAILGTQTNECYRVSHNLVRKEKPKSIIRWAEDAGIVVDWPNSCAYGDSANDLPMLNMVGNPFLVNPNPKAQRLGEGIPILRWDGKNTEA